MKYLIALVFVFLLAACDTKIDVTHPSSIDGTYTSLDGKDSYVFTASGEVQAMNFGKLKKTTYTLKDGTIKYQFEGGMPRAIAINSDGSLTSDTGTKLKKS